MHIFQIAALFKRKPAYLKGCYSHNMVRCLEKYHGITQKNDVQF
jgi:hypothetical protein